MPQVGPLELIVVALVALIVFGPDKLPEIARTVGRTMNELRRQAADVREEFVRGLDDDADDAEAPGSSAVAPTTGSLEGSTTPSDGAGPGA